MSVEAQLIREIEGLKKRLSRFEAGEFLGGRSGTWTPTFTGFSSAPSGPICRYHLAGSLCTMIVYMPNAGTSNATGFTITLPFTAKTVTGIAWIGPCQYTDSGTQATTPGLVTIGSAATTATIYKDWNGAAWTSSGNKKANFVLLYEVT